ncbi:hypothetical protein HanIR_Chr02g0064071 [Helianthus annuus]|nr:hypothetical protein HanIR_Chr02g0064071 [Helianthus annuus]
MCLLLNTIIAYFDRRNHRGSHLMSSLLLKTEDVKLIIVLGRCYVEIFCIYIIYVQYYIGVLRFCGVLMLALCK